MSFFTKIRGTMETVFQIGKAGPKLKNNSSVVEVRNAADSAFVIARALDPVGNDDLVTLRYFNANNSTATNIVVAYMPLAQATKVSTSSIPNNAIIVAARLDTTTAYDSGTTWAVTRTGDGTKVLMAAADSDPTAIRTDEVPQITNWGSTGAGTVTATITGTPAAGVSALYIFYTMPTDIS